MIVGFARSAVGQKEKPGNSGFKSQWFEKKMKERGFVAGDPWCALFLELILYEVYYGTDFEDCINRLCSKSAVETYKNFQKNGPFPTNGIPIPGAGVIWQYYENGMKTWKGHAGIVTDVGQDFFISVEGNGNSKGGREGIEVVIRKRNFDKPNNGLRVLGFIHPANLDI